MKKARLFCIAIITIFLITALTSTKIYANNDNTTKWVMIIINRIHYEDIAHSPTFRYIIENSGIGLMNTRAAGTHGDAKSYATIGWGIRAEADNMTSIFHVINDLNRTIFNRRTGNIANEGLINLNINRLLNQNLDGEYGATPGILGELLSNQGLNSVLIGSSEYNSIEFNPAGLILMDKKGHIKSGEISNRLIEEDLTRPFGIKTNYKFLVESFKNYYEKANLIVIETGDITRLEKYRENLNQDMYNIHRRDIISELDEFLSDLITEVDLSNTQIMIVSPFPSDQYSQAGDRLTPLIVFGGNFHTGLLTSSTTRRTGIIGNVDIAPTILNSFKIKTNQMVGNNISFVEFEDNYNYISNLNKKIVSISMHRYRVLYTFAVFQMIISILCVIIILLKTRFKLLFVKRVAKYALISTLVVPFTLLLVSIFGPMNIINLYLLIVIITLIIVLIIYFVSKGNSLLFITIITGLVTTSLVIDLVLGQPLIKNSIFGYDPIIGARYYGLGNEYMGILIGATLIFTACLLDLHKLSYKYTVPIFIIVLSAIGLPAFGANVGGTITAATVFVFAIMRYTRKKFSLKKAFIIIFSVCVILGTVALIDVYLSENKSHLAVALNQVVEHGPIALFQIAKRKIAMNLRIMTVTVWSRVLLIAMVILAILFYHPIGLLKRLNKEYPSIMIGLGSIVLGSKVAFLVNDSGIVAAATIMMFLTTTILFLVLSEKLS